MGGIFMATVYRKKNSKNWYAQWSVFDPKRAKWKKKQKSTGESSRALALDVAAEWLKEQCR
ncbi:MAG: hypothetical protein P1U85_23185 [Verrucomicrobiales bacterium]|nr:hypothetical protein [Verrucomicrobiales bacterium]